MRFNQPFSSDEFYKKKKRDKHKYMSETFKVVNIVAVMNCGFKLRLKEIWEQPECVKVLEDKWEKPYTYVQPKGATRPCTIFWQGNMISLGCTTISQAKRNLELTKNYLKKFRLKEK